MVSMIDLFVDAAVVGLIIAIVVGVAAYCKHKNDQRREVEIRRLENKVEMLEERLRYFEKDFFRLYDEFVVHMKNFH